MDATQHCRIAFCPIALPSVPRPSATTTRSICIRASVNASKTSPNPSIAAALAAVLLAIPIALPVRARLTENCRRVLPIASVSALAVSVLLRPRPILSVQNTHANRNSSSADADEEQPQRFLNDVLDAATIPNTSPSSLFQASRQEWDSPASSDNTVSTAPSADTATKATQNTTKTESSSVYSYSFASTRKKRKASSPPQSSSRSTDPSVSNINSHQAESRQTAGSSENVFHNMRSEFENGDSSQVHPNEQDRRYDEPDSNSERRRPSSEPISRVTPPQPITTSNLVSKVVRLPVQVLSEVILPLAHIISLVWYDWKVSILEPPSSSDRNSIDTLFYPPLEPRHNNSKRKAASSQHYTEDSNDNFEYTHENDGVQLSEEEIQIEQVRQVTKKTVKNVSSIFRKLMKEFL